MSGRRAVVRVPASSANLGPGFDVLACALELHVELEVEETGRFGVQTKLAIARDRRNLCVRAFELVHPPAGFTFRIRSNVPLSGGLGTSAAAIVAGLLAADALVGGGTDLLDAATRMEGHPDNVAAALLGGFVLCVGGRAERLPVPPGLAAVLVVPHKPVRTREARAALPAAVPISDAVFNVGHAGLLVAGLLQGDLALVARGLEDRLHQPHRAHLYPRSAALLRRAPELGALGATISGAGPSVLAWCEADGAAAVERALAREAGEWAEVRAVGFAEAGGAVLTRTAAAPPR